MISIIFMILKIIMIILLCCLGAVLTIAGLGLFVPVRYLIRGHRLPSDKIPLYLEIRLTWLLRLIMVSFIYPGSFEVVVKLLGFTIKAKEERSRNKGIPMPDEAEPENKTAEAQVNTEEENTAKERTKEEPHLADRQEWKSGEEDDHGPEETNDNITFSGYIKKVVEFIKNIKYTIGNIYDRIINIFANIRYYVELLYSKEVKNSITLCRNQLLKLLNMMKPRKWEVNLTLGTGDPASTGQILGMLCMLYPVLGNTVIVIPDFEEPVFEGNFMVKGRVSIYRLLIIGWTIYRNEDLRALRELLKREET